METLIIVALLLAFIPAGIASSKGRNFMLWYFYGFMLFVVALVHSLCISTSEKQLWKRGELKKCPNCAEYVKLEAKICKHCGSELAPSTLVETKTEIMNYDEKLGKFVS